MKRSILFAALFLALGIGLTIGSPRAHANTINVSSTGGTSVAAYQSLSGTITGWTVDSLINCAVNCAGSNAAGITSGLFLNGVEVSSSTNGTGASPATSSVTGLSIPFSFGDNLQIGATWGYSTNGIFGTITGTNLTNSSSSPSPSITFSFPTDGTTTGPFYFWQLEITAAPLLDDYILVASQWGSSSSLAFNPTLNDGALVVTVSSTQQIPNPHLPPTTWATSTYFASAGLFHLGSSTPYASSGIISFTLDIGATSTQNPAGTITTGGLSPVPSSTNCQYTSSSFFIDPVGNVREGICAALTFLFIPNASEQANLQYATSPSGTLGFVQKKPPFGYLVAASFALSQLSAATSSTSSLLSGSSSQVLGPALSPLDAGLGSIIFFMLILWFFGRGRHIDL